MFEGGRRFLVAVDGSPASDNAFNKAISLAKVGDEVITLCVVDFTQYILAQPLSVETEQGFGFMKEKMLAERGDIIEKYKKLVPDDNPQIKYTFMLENGNPREVILQVTIEKQVDTLVVGQLGLSSSKSAILGSTSEYCLRNCPCDVLICKQRTQIKDL